MVLEIPHPKMLTNKEELEIARRAVVLQPQSDKLVYRLASMLVRLDHFDEAIALLSSRENAEYRWLKLLYDAYIGLVSDEATLKARALAERAVHAAQTPRLRAAALADLAKTYTRLGEVGTSERLLVEALHEYPAEKDAYKRLARIYLRQDPERALRLAQQMIASDVLHARVLGSVVLCYAKMGRFSEAHAAEGLEASLLSKVPAAPHGWESLEAFNEALATEVLNHPGMRFDRYGMASTNTWRVDEPALHRSKVFPQLQRMIREEVLAYVANMPAPESPLARACPTKARLSNWCVVTEGEGHETWHVHQGGWMSGVYYIHVQDHIAKGTSNAGCLAFGISEEIAGDEAAAGFGEKIVRPYTGLLMMFPSHSFHKTYPHHGAGYRICFAFDIVPEDSAD